MAIFHLEAIIKILACGVLYFRDAWNKFDFLIILITDITVFLSVLSYSNDISTVFIILRALRLGRIVKFV